MTAPDPVETLRELAGTPLPVTQEPYVEYATVDAMRRFARSYGDDNPLFGDEVYGRAGVWGSVIAPPLFPLACGVPEPAPPDAALAVAWRDATSAPAAVVGDEWTLCRVIRPGTRLTRRDELLRAGRDEQGAARLTVRTLYCADGAVYAQHDRTRRYGAPITDEPPRDRAVYTDEQLAAIDAAYEREQRTGATTRRASQCRAGETIGPVVKGPLTLTDLVTYRGGVGPGPLGAEPLRLGFSNRRRRPDLYDRDASRAFDTRERLHWDDAYAQRFGHPGAYDYSTTRLTWVTQLITDWMGDGGRIVSLSFDLAANNYVGDTHWLSGTVVAIRTGVADGTDAIDLSVTGVNQLGALTCAAAATVVVPAPPRRVVADCDPSIVG